MITRIGKFSLFEEFLAKHKEAEMLHTYVNCSIVKGSVRDFIKNRLQLNDWTEAIFFTRAVLTSLQVCFVLLVVYITSKLKKK